MLPSVNASVEIPLVIIKTFGYMGFPFFQVSYRIGEILKASNERKPSPLVHNSYAIACKDKNGKTVSHVTQAFNRSYIFYNILEFPLFEISSYICVRYSSVSYIFLFFQLYFNIYLKEMNMSNLMKCAE